MSTTRVNLMPAVVYHRRASSRAARVWTALTPPTLVACALGVVMFMSASPREVHAGEAELLQATADANELREQETVIRSEIARLEAEKRAASVAEERIDWLLLLGMLDRVRGENVEFSAVEARVRNDRRDVVVVLSGTASTTSEAAIFVERLRDTGLFSDVQLPRTSVSQGGRTTFTATGIIDAGPGAAKGAATP